METKGPVDLASPQEFNAVNGMSNCRRELQFREVSKTRAELQMTSHVIPVKHKGFMAKRDGAKTRLVWCTSSTGTAPQPGGRGGFWKSPLRCRSLPVFRAEYIELRKTTGLSASDSI